MPLQLRRGVEADRSSVTPDAGEPLWVTDTNKLYVGDGSTAGGLLVSGGTDSAAVIALIDSAYIQARQADIFRDSAFVTNIIDTAYIQARDRIRDSNFVQDIVDSAYVQLRQDYAYSSLTGAPTTVSSFTNDAGYTTYDSANAAGQITAYGYTTYDSANFSQQLSAASGVSFDPAGTDNSTDVTLAGSYDYLTISTQQITLNQIDASTDISNLTTSNVTEGTNLYYTTARHDSDFGVSLAAASGVSFDPAGTDNSTDVTLAGSYDYLTLSGQQITLDQVDASTDISNLTTSNVTEGTNLYYTTARADSDAKAAISVTDAGGDGSLTYSAGTITYTGPSAAETRAHFSGGTGVTITSGSIAIGQAVGTSDNVTFADVTVDNLTVNGTTTTVNSITYTVTDPLLHLADSNETSDAVDIGFVGHYSDDGGSTKRHTGFFRDASNGEYYVFNGLVDAGLDSSLPVNVVNRSGTGFALAAFNAGTLAGKYLGIDSDLTAASGVKFDPVGTDNSTDVTLAGSYNYLTLSGQQITLAQIDASTDISGLATVATTGAYSDLSGTPTNVSTFTNDAGYTTYDSASFTGQLTSATGSSVQAYDANLTSFVTTFTLPTSDGTTGQILQTNGSGTLSFATVTSGSSVTVDSAAPGSPSEGDLWYDDTNTGQLYVYENSSWTSVSIPPSYIDSADVVSLINGTVTNTYLRGLIDDSSIIVDGNGSTGGVTIQDGGIEVRTGTSSVAYVDLYCEVNNAHRARIKSAPHSSYSGNVDLTLPVTTGTLAITSEIPVAGTDVLAYDANLQSFVTAFTLPTSDGSSNQVLVTNGAGTLSFADQSGGLDSAAIIALVDSAYVQLRQSATGGTDPIFKTISVSGQSDIVADTTTDTLTVAAGSGISITTDAGTDTLTIAATGGGGGLDSAAVLALTGVATGTATTYEFTATASQQTFSGTDDNSATLAYTAGNILVHRNGILLVSTVDYTATNGTSINLQAGADSGDTISITAYLPTLVNTTETTITSTVQDADSGQTSFTISHTEDQILVFLNGILLKDSDDYTSNGSTIVLTSAADSGDQLTVHNFAKYGPSGAYGDADVTALVDSAYVAARAGGGGGFDAGKTYTYSILFGG